MMQKIPLVTVITPSFNQGKYIEETILSVLNQEYPNIEYIVMDGGSTDGTVDILKKFSNRITWFSEKDKGQTDAINKGFRLAKGDILAYLNSDDTYLPGAIDRAVRYLTIENPDAKFVYGEGYHISAEGKIIERYPTESFNYRRLAETCFICQPTTFWKREVIEKIGFFDENLHYAMDYDYWIRIAKQYGTLWSISEYLANSRFYMETKTMSKRLEAHAEILKVVRNHYGRGNVPSTWIYAYAGIYMDRLVSRETKIKNLLFILGMTIIAGLKFLKYNHFIPLSEFKRWICFYIDAVIQKRSHDSLLKIGIDISLTIGEKAGIGHYTANLVDALARIDKKNQYMLYPFFYFIYHPDFKSASVPHQKNFHIRYNKLPKRIIDRLWHSSIPKKWMLGYVDVLHSTTFCSPLDHYGKLIVTIYDISFLTFPECHLEANRQHCLASTLDAIMYADKIITISNHGKEELIKYFNVDPDKVGVTHLAAKDIFTPRGQEEQDRVLVKYHIPRNFIFFVGSSEPRKNIVTLIRAYVNLPESIQNNYPLIIAGGKGWLNSDVDALIASQPSNHIFRLGYVSEQDLPALYSAAMVFVYPSLYEGFGLPILEAMSCGTPVITSNTSSMPEIGGDAALYINPTDVQQLTTLLLEVISDDDLRKELSWKGIERAKEFSWEKTARETLKIYENLYHQ
jgi:glycosyltransferase involved in cell wall biosynthesis/GT2 family glycosyltransferase